MTEIYNITDFTNGVKSSQLYTEIISNSNITTLLIGIRVHTLQVEIVFQSTISGSERTELDNLVSVHNPIDQVSLNKGFINNLSINWSGKSGIYTRIATFIFRGDILTIDNIKFVGHMASNSTSYDVRVINSSNIDILTEKNSTNISEQINDLGTILNIPTTETQLEIHARKNGGTEIYIENITFYLSLK